MVRHARVSPSLERIDTRASGHSGATLNAVFETRAHALSVSPLVKMGYTSTHAGAVGLDPHHPHRSRSAGPCANGNGQDRRVRAADDRAPASARAPREDSRSARARPRADARARHPGSTRARHVWRGRASSSDTDFRWRGNGASDQRLAERRRHRGGHTGTTHRSPAAAHG